MKLLLASGNLHKLHEFQRILVLLGCPWPITAAAAPAVAETGATYYQNAYQKAYAGLKVLAGGTEETVVLADDSGIELKEYGSLPGVRSARWTYRGRPARSGLSLFLRDQGMAAATPARFVCCIVAFVPGSSRCLSCEGIIRGTVRPEPRGTGGFGYDPLFTPEGAASTFGELPSSVKDRISHRARATAAFLQLLQDLDRMRP